MKTKTISKLFLTAIFILTVSLIFPFCNSGKDNSDNTGKKVLTDRIQYDVLIKTPDPDLDWWTQNIEGSKRENFIRTFLKLASDGKVKAYDYYNNPMTPDEVKKIGNSVDTITIDDVKNPNSTYDTVIKNELNIQEVTKVRFLEEWYLDEKKMSFDKKVVGLMLMRENYGDSLQLRGYSPLFWIYFDDKYPACMK